MFCRHYQSAIQNDLDEFGNIRRPILIGHLQKCSGCRAFYHQIKDMEEQLRAEPSTIIAEEQVHRIRAVVQQRLAEDMPTQSTLSDLRPFTPIRFGYGLTAAAAVLLVSLLGIYYFHRTPPGPSADPAAQFVSQATVLQNSIGLLAGYPEQSLQTEIQKLAGDARMAVNFIAECIPSNPAGTNTSRDSDNSAP